MSPKSKILFVVLAGILILKGFLILLAMPYSEIGLAPDEAQYWTWSKQLDWGYYSKPPGIAWQIWLGTHLLGDTVQGIRLGALLIGFLLPLALYALAKACGTRTSTALWSGIVMALTPLGMMSSFLSTTDAGHVLFWTFACCILVSAIKENRTPNYLLIGFFILCGALFKWTIYLFWPLVLVYLLFFSRTSSKGYFNLGLGLFISLLGLFPSLIWNIDHDWATFKHVKGNVVGGSTFSEGPWLHGNLWEFIGAQAALFSPILFALLIFAYFSLGRYGKIIPEAVRFCGVASLFILGSYAFLSLFQKMQGNWCVYAYPTAIVLLCWVLNERVGLGGFWLRIGVTASSVMALFVLHISYLQGQNALAHYPISYAYNPFKHHVGWNQLENVLGQIGYDPEKHFLFSDKYQTTSILSFYSPNKKRAYFLNLGKARKNQFSYWPGMKEEQLGRSGYFVWIENAPKFHKAAEMQTKHYQQVLGTYFQEVRLVGEYSLFMAYGDPVKCALIFECIGYNGQEPPETDLY